MSPAEVVSLWKAQIEPLKARGVKLVSPAITNGGEFVLAKIGDQAPLIGVKWMKQFLDQCTGCQIDAIAVHWYATHTAFGYFQEFLTTVAKQFNKPIWLTEVRDNSSKSSWDFGSSFS